MLRKSFQTHCGSVRYSPKDKLGQGAFASVFAGSYKGEKAAVKIIPISKIPMCKHEVALQTKLEHENVLKLLAVIDEGDEATGFRFIVLKLCAGTLEHFVKGKYKGPMPSDVQVLYQIACGVNYIHSMNLIHRDIKPENILISCTTPVVMKVSDFGLSKNTSNLGTYSLSGIKGTPVWMAPEFLQLVNSAEIAISRGSVKSDIFSTGCIFFYFIKRGIHPFGEGVCILANILSNNPVNIKQLPMKHFAYDFIENMIKKVGERIALADVIEKLAEQQLTTTKHTFKAITRKLSKISEDCCSRFHPTDSVLACGSKSSSITATVTILKAANGSIPISSWKIELELEVETTEKIVTMEWNVNGTQLAAGFDEGTINIWSYPSGHVLVRRTKRSRWVDVIAWNPFRQDILATFYLERKILSFWNTQENGDDTEANHFVTIKRDVNIWRVAWISANQIALALDDGRIEICQIDDKGGLSNSRFLQHTESAKDWIRGLLWDETTGYLAACSLDGWIKIWSMENNQPVHSSKVDSRCHSLACRLYRKPDSYGDIVDVAKKSKENLQIACGLEDGTILIWNPLMDETDKDLIFIRNQQISNRKSRVQSLSFSPDGQFLASADGHREMIIWSTETWQPVFTCNNVGGKKDFSWLSSDSSSVPVYKLADYSWNEISVVEQSFAE